MRLASILAGALLAAATPAAALMLRAPLDELVGSSDAIVRAGVLSTESRWLDDPRVIVTEVKLEVREPWRGGLRSGAPLTLTVLGGEVGGMGMKQEHQPEFRAGEEVVLFLKATPSARWAVNYEEQGKYTVLGEQVVGFDRQPMMLAAFKAAITRWIPGRAAPGAHR